MDSLFRTVAAVGRVLVQGAGLAVETAKDVAKDVADSIERDRRLGHGSGYASAFVEDQPAPRPLGYGFHEEWKERLVFTEARGTYTFDCAWGDFRRPYHVYVPTAEHWDRATPEFMHGRRDEILDRLRGWAGCDYVIHEFGPED